MASSCGPSRLDGYLTVGEAADELGVSRSTMRNWDKAGKLKPRRHPLNGYRLYRRSDLEDLLRRAEAKESVDDE